VTTVDPAIAAALADLSPMELDRMEKLLEVRQCRLKFALEHHVNTRGEAMDFTNFPHIKELYNSVAAEIVLQGSVQSFKSEWSVIDHFAMAQSGLSVFFVVPKFEARTTFVQNRVNRCVERVPEYKKIIGRGFFDSVAMKNFGKGVVKYVGSNVLSDFKEFPGDVLVVDEVDECDAENVEYALDRLRASRYQFKRYIGNPKLEGRGINAFYQRSDQREWFVPCLECNQFHLLDWFETIVRGIEDSEGNIVRYELRDEEWEEGCGNDIKCICPDCGGELERASVRGEWRAQNPKSSIEGYHISMMCSLLNTVGGMWDRFVRAQGDPMKLQQFYNSELGLPFSAAGNKVTEPLLDRNIEEGYQFIIKYDRAHIEEDRHEGPCSMGVDVGSRFDVRVSAPTERGGRRTVFIGKLSTLDDIYEVIEQYNVEKIVMDSMPEVHTAQEFQEHCAYSLGVDVWLCRYSGEGSEGRIRYNPSDRMISADRTMILDRGLSQLKAQKNILPENHKSILNGEFVDEMCGPVRQVVEDNRGNSKFEWSKCKDHQRHADIYDYMACKMMVDAVIEDIESG